MIDGMDGMNDRSSIVNFKTNMHGEILTTKPTTLNIGETSTGSSTANDTKRDGTVLLQSKESSMRQIEGIPIMEISQENSTNGKNTSSKVRAGSFSNQDEEDLTEKDDSKTATETIRKVRKRKVKKSKRLRGCVDSLFHSRSWLPFVVALMLHPFRTML